MIQPGHDFMFPGLVLCAVIFALILMDKRYRISLKIIILVGWQKGEKKCRRHALLDPVFLFFGIPACAGMTETGFFAVLSILCQSNMAFARISIFRGPSGP